MFETNQKRLSYIAILVLSILVALCVYLIWRFRQKSHFIQQIQETSYTQVAGNSQWPLSNVNNQLNNYLVRIVLDENFQLDNFEYQGLIIRAWSHGSYLDAHNNLQRIAVPRVWYNPTQQKLFFLSTVTSADAPIYADEFLVGILNKLKQHSKDKQNLAAVFFIPNDLEADVSLTDFFETLESVRLPNSFLLTGSTQELPKAPKVGAFFPATQLTFDIGK